MPPAAAPLVRHVPALARFECTVEGHLSIATYQRDGDVLRMTCTCVPPALQGRGIAAALVATALAHAWDEGLTVDPVCSYVAAYMRRHPGQAPMRGC